MIFSLYVYYYVMFAMYIILLNCLFYRKERNIVIILCKGYSNKTITTFFATLKSKSPNSYLLIFGNNYSIILAKKIYNENKKVMGIELLNTYPYYPSNDETYPITHSVLMKYIPTYISSDFKYFYHIIRFYLANIWIKIYGKLYESFLLCDVKDIIFQANPFTLFKVNGLYLQEEAYIRRGKSGIFGNNYYWMKDYKPNKTILVNAVINSGQILGNFKEMNKFLSQFCIFMNLTHIRTAEQGSLNYFIYSGIYKRNYTIQKYGYGFALLLHDPLCDFKDIHTPKNNYIYNFDGSIPPLLHGYQLGFYLGSKERIKKYKEYLHFHTSY